MRRQAAAAAVLSITFLAGLAGAGDGGKPGKPQLELRASPRLAMSPVSVLVTGQLKGGVDLEDFHCPALEWDWGDGTHSRHEADCAPFEPGASVERFFRGRHAYPSPGAYHVRLTLRRADRTVVAGSVTVTVHGGQTASLSDY